MVTITQQAVTKDDTIVTPSNGGYLVDATGSIVTMNITGAVMVNGATVPGSAGTEEITIVSGVVYAFTKPNGPWLKLVDGELKPSMQIPHAPIHRKD